MTSKSRTRLLIVGVVAALLAPAAAVQAPMASHASTNNPATDAFSGTYGVMSHYLKEWLDPAGSDWNSRVDDFDVNGYASDVAATGASYVVFTLEQNSGYFVSPNATYDSYTGYSAGERTSTRDLPLDLYNALNPLGIKLFLYLPSGAPELDAQAKSALGWSGSNTSQSFQDKWENVIEEWSNRYGNKVAGWWFDGVYTPSAYSNYSNAHNFNTFAAAAKSGNSNSIVAFNSGFGFNKLSDAQDYTAGESNYLTAVPSSRWQNGLQWQALSFLGYKWNDTAGRLQYSHQEVADYLASSRAAGGMATIDVGTSLGGRIVASHVNQLKAVRASLDAGTAGQIVDENVSGVTLSGFAGTATRPYDGYWTNGSNADPTVTWVPSATNNYNQDVAYATANGAFAEYTFIGTGVQYISERANDLGAVDVYIDGVFHSTVSGYVSGASQSRQALFSIDGLSAGSHTIKVVKTGGQYMLLDAFRVTRTANNESAGLTYSGTWGRDQNRGVGNYSDDVRFAAANGASAQYTFTGTGVSFITERDIDMGSVDVYIDNVFVQTVNCYGTGGKKTQQVAYSATGLAPGSHTLKLVKTSGQYMIVDALVVTP